MVNLAERQPANSWLAPLSDPRFLVAVVVLAVNDHWLKATVGAGPLHVVTGKLSDFAGLVVLPVLVGAAVGRERVRPMIIGLGVWFALLKTVAPVAVATTVAADVLLPWSNRIVVDATDLVALSAVLLALAIIRRPLVWSVPKAVRVGIFAGAALASVATSTDDTDTESLGLDPVTGEIVLGGGEEGVAHQTMGCRPSNSNECFRFQPGATIEQSNDAGGTWHVVWEVDSNSTSARRAAGGSYGDLVPFDIAVTDLEVGVAFRNMAEPVTMGADGIWRPTEKSFRNIPWDSVAGLLIVTVLAVMMVAGAVVRHRSAERKFIGVLIAGFAVAGIGAYAAVVSALVSDEGVLPASIVIVVPVFAQLILCGLYLAGEGDPLRGYSNGGRLALVGLVITAVVSPIVPFVVWESTAAINYYGAWMLSVLIAVGVVGATALLTQTSGR